MGMSPSGFLDRLRSGKSVNCAYRQEERTGLISAWHWEGKFILTWEECQQGEQYDESRYTRDERHTFATAEEVQTFVEQSGYPTSLFEP